MGPRLRKMQIGQELALWWGMRNRTSEGETAMDYQELLARLLRIAADGLDAGTREGRPQQSSSSGPCECEVGVRARREILLAEYDATGRTATEHETSVWQSGGIIFAAAIGGVVYVLANFSHDLWGVVATVLTAGGAMLLLQCWIRLQDRLHELTTVHMYRRQEIEKELGMLDSRYIDWLDSHHWCREPHFPPTEKERPLFENARCKAGCAMTPGSAHRNRVLMARIAQGAWALTVILQALWYYLDP
jgi:hypothetical protein